MPPELPARIGPYDVVGLIGSGHLGSVYRAFDQAHTRSVAIRVLSPDLLADATRLERFRRGVRTLSTVVHDNLTRVLDEGQDGDLVYVVTEFVDGCALFDRLQSSRLTLAEAIRVLRDVADGLGAAHRTGLVHGDLNPRNVLVSRDLSVVKVGDFGTADIAHEEGSTRTAVLARARTGVLLYRAPELGRARGEASVRSDLYSLGVIAYEAMTGKLPVGKFSLPSDLNNQVPLELDPIVLRCLATDPAQRYQSVAAFETDLDKVEEVVDYRLLNELKRLSGGRLFAKKGTAEPARRRPARAPLTVGLAAILLVAAAVTAALLLRGRGDGPSSAEEPSAPAVASAQPAPAAPPPTTGASPPSLPSAPASAPPSAAMAAAAPPLLVSSAVSPSTFTVAPGAPPPRLAEAAARPAASPGAPAPGWPVQSGADRPGAPPAGARPTGKPAEGAREQEPGGTSAPRDGDKAAGILYKEAQALIRQNQDLEARTRLAQIGERYSQTAWFVPAMMVKIDIEERHALREPDPVVGQVAPASLRTKRLLTERAPRHSTAEAAWWQLGESYERLKQYALAAQAYVELATRFPDTRHDAWFKAGEIAEQRLKNTDGARAAYLKVPPASAHYREAQDRARKLTVR